MGFSYLFFVNTYTFLCPLCNPEDGDIMTLYHGEDFHIMLPSLGMEVTFHNRSAPRASDVVLMSGGVVVNNRTKLNRHLSHLIIDAVGEGDEGVYTVKNPDKPEDIKRITLYVRGTGWHLKCLHLHHPHSLSISVHSTKRKIDLKV